MVKQVLLADDDYYVPDAKKLVTEDDAPVDNFGSEKQQRLLVGILYSSLQEQTMNTFTRLPQLRTHDC